MFIDEKRSNQFIQVTLSYAVVEMKASTAVNMILCSTCTRFCKIHKERNHKKGHLFNNYERGHSRVLKTQYLGLP